MKLINNLKHALTVAHTIMSLNMFLRAIDASQLLPANFSPVVHIKEKYYHYHLFCFTFPYLSVTISRFTPQYMHYLLCNQVITIQYVG